MKKITLLLILTLFLTSCGRCETEICIKEKVAIEKLRQEQEDKYRLYELEKMKIQAEIEKNKPTEVKVAEIQSTDTSIGEGIATGVGVAGATYIIGKLLDN